VSAGTRAVAVGRNRLLVEVVHEGTARCGKTREGDLELDAGTIRARLGDDSTTERAAFLDGQSGDVGSTNWVSSDLGGRDSRGLGANDRGRSKEREDGGAHLDVEQRWVWKDEDFCASC
jgi:hypothetical protein